METDIDDLIIESITNFIIDQRPIFDLEQVYGFCFIYPEEGHHLICAIGTEERLNKIASNYAQRGYFNTETGDNYEMNDWLRWGSPEDGWAGFDSKAFNNLNEYLALQAANGKVKLFTDHIRKRITKNIKRIKNIVPHSEKIVFIFSNGWFDVNMKPYVQRINSSDIYLRWLREQCKSEYLCDKFQKNK